MGNTPFEHFSSHWYICLKSSILLWSLFGFIYDLLSKWFENRGLIAYTMTWVLRYGEIQFWDICFWEFSILIYTHFDAIYDL